MSARVSEPAGGFVVAAGRDKLRDDVSFRLFFAKDDSRASGESLTMFGKDGRRLGKS